MNDLILKGSQTAKNGFKNEQDIARRFNDWQKDDEAQKWLLIMKYQLDTIEWVKAIVISGYKADINVQVQIKIKEAVDVENIQIKLVSNKKGYNQIDKRRLQKYSEMWNIPEFVYKSLQYFTGELAPYKVGTKDKRRMFINEMKEIEKNSIIEWFNDNKMLILTDVLRGRGEFSAEWVLVAQKVKDDARWVLKNINEVLQYYSEGTVCMSPRGSLLLGRVCIQRKGGDNGRDTAKMLQFKVDPSDLFNI